MGAVRQVHVHIGPYKSGTTYVQNVLWRNRELLASRGVLVPRGVWPAQRRAVAALLRRVADLPAEPPRGPAGRVRPRDPWDRLVAEVEASDAHTAVVSVERLCEAEADDVAALAESLAPARVDVVYTARNLAWAIPGGWQTLLRTRFSPTWREYLDSVREPSGPAWYGRQFWRRQDPSAVLPPWLAHLPVDRVHVVTVPVGRADPALLWERFCAATGLDPVGADLDVSRSNVSLGGVEAEALRRLTARTAEVLSARAYLDVVNHFVARDVLERREQSFRLELSESEHGWARARADEAVAYLRGAGLHVVGDLDDLLPDLPQGIREPDDVSEAEVLALTTEVLAATVVELARRTYER